MHGLTQTEEDIILVPFNIPPNTSEPVLDPMVTD
jgi:hypothetical protein